MLLVQQLAELPSLAWGWLLAPLALAAGRWPRYVLPPLFLLAGLWWAGLRAGWILSESLPEALEGVDLVVEGRIADLPVPHERGVRFIFDVVQSHHDHRPVAIPRRLQLNVYGRAPPLAVGDRWRLTVRLRRPRGFQNPGGFDYEAHLLQQRIRATGYVRDAPAAVRLAALQQDRGWLLPYRLNRFRQELSERIQRLLAGHAFTAMVTAFANGDDDSISDAHWEVLNRTGTGHLVAISGMNIGLVAGIAYFLLRWLWSLPARTVLWLPAPRVAAVGALVAACGYAALAGFAIPTQRALAMLAVALGGLLLGRRTAPSVLLALALLAVLLFDPLAVLAAGFWLSFLAVAVILYVVGPMRGAGWLARLRAWGWLQWAVALGLLPVLLFLFQQVSVSGPLANLIAIPVVEIVVIPATLAGVVASLVLPDNVAALPLQLAATALEQLWPVLELLARWPGALWTQHAPPPWALWVALAGVVLLLLPRGYPARALGVIYLLPLFLARPAAPAAGELRLTLLDVGQGLAVTVRTASHALVYDTGARFSARFDAGRAVVVPYLRHAGVRRVDTLIVSHGDNDHIGGSASLRAMLPVDRVLSSVPERLPGSEPCRAGQAWEWDGVRFEMLHPPLDGSLAGNNRSCVLRVTGAHGRALLTGDIAERAERRLLREHAAQLPAELLVVPHHGSKTSSTGAFLDRVRPKVALLPVGYRNRYRHPHPKVVERYRERGIALVDSPAAGAIEARFGAAGFELRRHRDGHRRYWHRR